MITFPAIWWIFPAAALALILLSLYLAKSGSSQGVGLRRAFVVLGALLGFLALVLPLFRQPYFRNPVVNFGVGLPLVAVGLIGRVYPMLYLRRCGTTTALGSVERLVDTGPYGWVRHPQYTFGFILLCGWFLVWGAVYSLCMLPLIGGMVYVQAWIEEAYILSVKFEEYTAYRKRVGMLVPRLRNRRR